MPDGRALGAGWSSSMHSRDSSTGTPLSSWRGDGGCSVCLRVITCSESPSNGRRPSSDS